MNTQLLQIKDLTLTHYYSWLFITVLCFLNLSFFLQHIVTIIFAQKMKRSWSFPTVNQLTDLVLFICSIITLEFIFGSMLENLVDQRMTEEDFVFRVVFNIFDHIWFKFEYVFAIMIVCLIMRLLILLEFNQSIGPLIKIVGKMAKDFWNFFLLYAMITIMFSIVGNLNLLIYLNNLKVKYSNYC